METSVGNSLIPIRLRAKSLWIFAFILTSLIFLAQFLPSYIGSYGFALKPLFHKPAWQLIGKDAWKAFMGGVIVIGMGLYRIHRIKKAQASTDPTAKVRQ